MVLYCYISNGIIALGFEGSSQEVHYIFLETVTKLG